MNVIKRISKKSKGYFCDSGQVCFSQAISSFHALATHPLLGVIFETAVVNEIYKQLYLQNPCNLYHCLEAAGAECDLILERDGLYYPIEIKAKSHPMRKDTRGITAFRKTYPHLSITEELVICLSENCYKISENDYAIPWNIRDFL